MIKTPTVIQGIKSLKRVALISAAVNKGQNKSGTELAPEFILKNNKLVTELTNLNVDVVDYARVSDAKPDPKVTYDNIKNFSSITKTNFEISELVSKSIREGFVPVVLGGDHSVGLGSVHGSFNAKPEKSGLIWIDAHCDINTPSTTYSGNFHGQPLSFLIKEMMENNEVPKIEQFSWIKPNVITKDIVYIGLRDIDPDEVYILEKYKIKAFSMTDVQRMGVSDVMNQTFQHLTADGQVLPLHVSVDIDALDPWFAPSTGTPVLGGLTLPELMQIGNMVHETGKLKALDLVEVNPLLGESDNDRNKTVFSAIRAIISFFGYNTRGTYPSGFVHPKPK